MIKIYHLLFALIGMTATSTYATSYTINTTGNFTFDPAELNVVVGDDITIQASSMHPLAQVTESTWNSNQSTAMVGGFGVHTSSHTFTVTTTETIYFVCQNHVASSGMKGKINVTLSTGIIDAGSVTDLKVYPSIVTDGVFNVSAETDVLKGATVELFNTNGQLMQSFLLESESAVLKAKVATGTYMAVIRKGNEAILRQRMIFVAE